MRNDIKSRPNMGNISASLQEEITLLCRKSLIVRLILWLGNSISPLKNFGEQLEADVSELESNPLGMYIYNFRVLFLFLAGIFLAVLIMSSQLFGWWALEEVRVTLVLFGILILLSLVTSSVLHRDFAKQVAELEQEEFANVLALFRADFLVDGILIISAVLFGRVFLGRYLDGLVFLIIADLVLYSACMAGRIQGSAVVLNPIESIVVPVAIASIAISYFAFDWTMTLTTTEVALFRVLVFWGPIVASIWVVILSIGVVSYLRSWEWRSSQNTMELVVSLVSSIERPEPIARSKKEKKNIVASGMTLLLRQICSIGNEFKYYSARMWTFQDGESGSSDEASAEALILLASYARKSAIPFPKRYALHLQGINEIVLIKDKHDFSILAPVGPEGGSIGVLELNRDKAPMNHQEKHFAKSLADILYTAERHFRSKQETQALTDVDRILSDSTLEQVFRNAAGLLREHLTAQGSMMLLIKPTTREMQLVASEGFDEDVLRRNRYFVGRGLTGLCAEKGELRRINDVERNISAFDGDLLENLSQALGSRVTSWMAIPIGKGKDCLGILKVVNKRGGGWFTEYDQRLAESLTQKLKVVLEKSIHLQNVQDAQKEAVERAMVAERQKQKAEGLANARLDDLMTLSHQLQAPLGACIGRMSNLLSSYTLSPSIRRHLESTNLILYDALDMTFGTFIVTGLDAGSKSSFNQDTVIISNETKDMFERLRLTNNRPDLRLRYEEPNSFPILQIDRRLFRSVLYTLLHNASKYADKYSYVTIECGFEWSPHEEWTKYPAIKVKSYGAPIRLHEKELIFNRFYRGESVKSTAIHGGPSIGLGLWVAKNLMKEYGGDLTLELSDTDEKLSVFVIHLKGENHV